MDWHGLARIGTDWQIGQFVCQGKIGTGLARIGTGLARSGTDWHGLAQIDTDWQIGKFV